MDNNKLWPNELLQEDVRLARKMIGTLADDLIIDPSRCVSVLSSSNDLARYFALHILQVFHPLRFEVANQCETLCKKDSNESVRCVALTYLGLWYSYSN